MLFFKRLAYLLPWRRRAAERDMHEELRSLAEMAAPGELGNLTLAAEDARAVWGWTRLEQALQDVRYALHTLKKSPVFTATAVLSLALGIGANTALFSLIDGVMWRLLPVAEPEHLLVLGQRSRDATSNGFTYQQYELVRDHVPALQLAAYSNVRFNVSIAGAMEPPVEGQLVTGEYFPLLGIRPGYGRLLGPDDNRVPMGHPVVVLSDRYWKQRFGGDPSAVGSAIALSGVPFTIVGIAPPEFFGTEVGVAPSLFAPLMMQPVVMPMTVNLVGRNPNVFSAFLRVVGRFAPGATPPVASAQLDALAATEETDWRPRNKFTGEREDARLVLTSAATGLSDLRRQFSQPLFMLLGAAVIVLLVACANVGNLVLARAAARRPEFALRLALGARPGRLFRQMLTEAFVLAIFAGVASVAVAYWATRTLVLYASAGQRAIEIDLSPDLRMLGFTALVSLTAGLLLGCVPALRAARTGLHLDPRRDLALSGHGARASGRVLVMAQIALSLVLLLGAGLFGQSLTRLTRDDSTVDRSQVLIVKVEPRGSGDRHQPGRADAFDRTYRELVASVERIPGIEAASLARPTPLSPAGYGFRVVPQGGGTPEMVPALIVYPKYFAVMGIPVLKGRDFNDDDVRSGAARAVVVNEAFVRHIIGGRDPLGTSHGVMEPAPRRNASAFPLNIIGVVKDSRYPALRGKPLPTVYQPFLQANTGFGNMVLHARVARSGGTDVIRQIREAVQAVDPVVPLFDIHTLADEVDGALLRERLVATLSGVFGFMALALVSIGLYGLLAFNVSRRTAEIGIRVALGAAPEAVRWMIARQALGVVLAGLALGLPAAWIAGRLAARQIASLLFELTPTDPPTIVGAIGLLVAVGLAAAWLPARRASRIDPIVALRTE
jgi:predicted permease